MTIVLATTNRWKVPEYRRFFARHAEDVVVEPKAGEPAALAAWLTTARAVLADESNIFDEAGDQVRATHVGPARNVCRLHAWTRADDGAVARRTYIREVRGHFDGSLLRPEDPDVFDWDVAFRATAGPTLDVMDRVGLKNSAREQCLSAFAKGHLHRAAPQRLRWTDIDDAPFSLDVALLTGHPLYQRLSPPLASALAAAVDGGVFFRAKKSRRDGNYWFPGLNGGLPYVPKKDAIHEATYLFHDVMHHLMPDLVFDGADTRDHARVYIAYRMMSEGVSLVLADMLFVDGLAADPANAGYDFGRRRIYPLFLAIEPARRADLRWLLQLVTGFVLRGDPGALPIATEAWRAFDEKYTRFFVADFQWTRMNWESLTARSKMVRDWIALVGAEAFERQGVWFLSRVVEEIGRDRPLEELCARLFDVVWERRIAPALAFAGAVDPSRARSAGFRRWLTGQVAFFARYAPIVAMPPLATELAARIRDPRPFDDAEMAALRLRFGDHVRALARDGILSSDDAEIFPDLFPLFDPFFLRDYDLAQQEFPTVAAASARAFGA